MDPVPGDKNRKQGQGITNRIVVESVENIGPLSNVKIPVRNNQSVITRQMAKYSPQIFSVIGKSAKPGSLSAFHFSNQIILVRSGDPYFDKITGHQLPSGLHK